jgi:lysyl-tRNA synthetase class I
LQKTKNILIFATINVLNILKMSKTPDATVEEMKAQLIRKVAKIEIKAKYKSLKKEHKKAKLLVKVAAKIHKKATKKNNEVFLAEAKNELEKAELFKAQYKTLLTEVKTQREGIKEKKQ